MCSVIRHLAFARNDALSGLEALLSARLHRADVGRLEGQLIHGVAVHWRDWTFVDGAGLV